MLELFQSIVIEQKEINRSYLELSNFINKLKSKYFMNYFMCNQSIHLIEKKINLFNLFSYILWTKLSFFL